MAVTVAARIFTLERAKYQVAVRAIISMIGGAKSTNVDALVLAREREKTVEQ